MISMCFDEAFLAVSKEIDSILSSAPMVIRSYTSHLMQAKGKSIRAYSCIACALDKEDKVHQNAVIFAAAIEILHLATLVHDDVMDNADVRRGIATLNKKFGRKTAVICGDYLLAAALTEMTKIAERDQYTDFTLPNYVERICMGELRQHINNGNLKLSMYRYLTIISGKTAALFEASFYAGGILCETDAAILKQYRKLGHCIGMIFQLVDDCIDFERDVSIAKKNVQSDYEQGVITLPVIYTFHQCPKFLLKAENGALDREALNQSVRASGGLNFTREIARRYYGKADKMIEEMDLSQFKKEKLLFILNKTMNGLNAGGKK